MKPAQVDRLAFMWREIENRERLTARSKAKLKTRILAAAARYGQIGAKSKSGKTLRGLELEILTAYPVETLVDKEAAERLMTRIHYSLRCRLFEHIERYALRPGAHEFALQLTARNRWLFERAISRRAMSARVRVVKAKRKASLAPSSPRRGLGRPLKSKAA